MNKLAVFAVMLLVLPVVFAQQVTCTDTDGGGLSADDVYIGEKGAVKYGLSEKDDTCLHDKNGYSVATGVWLREYFCDNQEQRAYKDYDCVRYGFDKCDNGQCVGKEIIEEKKAAAKAAEPAKCGDKNVDSNLGEQCDPPDSICYGDNGNIGLCTRPNDAGYGGCQCDLYKSGGEVEEEPEEEAEEETTEEEPEETVKEEVAEEPKEEERKPLPEEIKEPKGIGFTRSISNFFKKMFGWMFGWLK